jgi:L-2-hydroxyglutarate oxidase LhgO
MSGGQVSVVTDDTLCVALRALLEQNRRNGVDGLQWLDAGQVRQLEPAVSCVAALWSPSRPPEFSMPMP